MSSVFEKQIPKSRLRESGVKTSKSRITDKILALLEIAPRKNSEIATEIGYARQHCYTTYVKPLITDGKIKKVPGTDVYQLAKDKTTHHDVKRRVINKSVFYKECSTIRKWTENTSSTNLETELASFLKICTGGRFKEFTIDPDNWQHPETTKQIVQVFKDSGMTRLSYNNRQTIRHFIIYGMELTISKEEGKRLGIDGDKMEANLGSLEMTREQYNDAKAILKKKYPREYLEFGFNYNIFCRPSVRKTVRVDSLIFYDRELEFVKIGDKKIFNKDVLNFVRLIPEIAKAVKIHKFTHRACRMHVFEFKTMTSYPKYIYDEDFVKDLEKYVAKRKFQKKKYLFWDDNNITFEQYTYRKVVSGELQRDNAVYKEVFFSIGFKPGDFGKIDKANYALRHFGLQNILQLTDYNFGLVTQMSHKDIQILMDWYGKMAATHLEKKMDEVVF